MAITVASDGQAVTADQLYSLSYAANDPADRRSALPGGQGYRLIEKLIHRTARFRVGPHPTREEMNAR